MSSRPKPFSFPGVRHPVVPLPSTFRIADSFPCGFENHSCQRPVLLSLRAGLCAFWGSSVRGARAGGTRRARGGMCVGRTRVRVRRAGWAGWLCEVRRGTGAHQGVGAGCGAAVVRAGIAWFCVVENPPYLWHFAPERSSFSVNGFAILFMNNHEYMNDMRKQLSGEYNVNN